MWAVYETNVIVDGPYSGKTLAEISAEAGDAFLGTKVTSRIGDRFPVLIKLLDCNQWLSVQVHPDDRQAAELEGEGQFGKTEAWYFLETEADAEIICGIKPGISKKVVEESIRQGTILSFSRREKVTSGDHVLIPAGTIHALGPGMLVYEVQESSDITYRVYDWDRPASQGRMLHIEQSVKVINPDLQAEIKNKKDGSSRLLSCDYFTLEKLASTKETIETELDGTTFHVLTVISGSASINGDGWQYVLAKFDSLVIPACVSRYGITLTPDGVALRVTA
jgi:mannose-6-phosphate isomerase